MDCILPGGRDLGSGGSRNPGSTKRFLRGVWLPQADLKLGTSSPRPQAEHLQHKNRMPCKELPRKN